MITQKYNEKELNIASNSINKLNAYEDENLYVWPIIMDQNDPKTHI